MQRPQELRLNRVLNHFPLLSDTFKGSCEDRIARLDGKLAQEQLCDCLENIRNRSDLLTDKVFNAILSYLELLSNEHDNAIIQCFSVPALKSIAEALPRFETLRDGSWRVCHAVRYGLCKRILMAGYLVDSVYFKDEAGIKLLNVCSDTTVRTESIILVLNHLAQFQNIDFKELAKKLNQTNLLLFNEVLTKTAKLELKINDHIEDWSYVTQLSSQWFSLPSKTLRDFWAQLDAKLRSHYGIRFVFTRFVPAQLTRNVIAHLNNIVRTIIPAERPLYDNVWMDLSVCLFADNIDSVKIIARLKRLHIIMATAKFDPVRFQQALNFLVFKPDFLDQEDAPNFVAALLKIHERFYGKPGYDLYARIVRQGIELNDDYIKALNEILAKTQLAYIAELQNLPDYWLTLEGLQRLAQFRELYLTHNGLLLLANLPFSEITSDVIDNFNRCDHSILIRRYVTDRHEGGPKTVDVDTLIPLAGKLSRLNDAITMLRNTSNKADFTVNLGDTSETIRRYNSKALLTNECPLSTLRLLSKSAKDEPIIAAYENQRAIVLADLAALAWVKAGPESKILCSRAVLQGLTKHPYLMINEGDKASFKDFTDEDIIELKEEDLDLDYLNEQLGLKAATTQSHSERRLAYLKSLEDSPESILSMPECLSSVELLLQLDERFYTVPYLREVAIRAALVRRPNAVLALNKIVGFLESEGVIAQRFYGEGCLFLDLDSRYFTQPGMYAYLERSVECLTPELVVELNNSAEVLFKKLSIDDKMALTIYKLPSQFFVLEEYQPAVFAKIPDPWLTRPNLIGLMRKWSKRITPQFIKEGMNMLTKALSVEDASSVFAQSNLGDLICLWGYDGIIKNLTLLHKSPEFNQLLPIIQPYITVELLGHLKLNDGKHQQLCISLYTHASCNKGFFAGAVLLDLRDKVKQIKLQGLAPVQRLDQLSQAAKDAVTKLKQDLNDFRDRKLIQRGDDVINGWMTTPAEVVAYKAITAAAQGNPASTFIALENVMRVQQAANIKATRTMQVGMLPFINSYLETFDSISLQVQELLNSIALADEAILRACLLDDFCFNHIMGRFTLESVIEKIVKKYPRSVVEILEDYRPVELCNLLNMEWQVLPSKKHTLITKVADLAQHIDDKITDATLSFYIFKHSRIFAHTNPPAPDASITVEPISPATPSSKVNGKDEKVSAVATTVNSPSVSSAKPIPKSRPVVSVVVDAEDTSPKAAKSLHHKPSINKAPSPMTDIQAINGSGSGYLNGGAKTPLPFAQMNPVSTTTAILQNFAQPPALVRLQHQGPKLYQLEDPDMNVGIQYLRELADPGKRLPSSPKFSEEYSRQDLYFFSPGPIAENPRNDEDNPLPRLKSELLKNQGKICFGAFNYKVGKTTLHYFAVFMYLAADGSRPVQILIIDPAFETKNSSDKAKTVATIKKLFSKEFQNARMLTTPILTQQFNDADCGFCCLRLGKDLIANNVVAVVDNELNFYRERLTLDGEKFIGNEIEFAKLIKKNRDDLVVVLKQYSSWYVQKPDGELIAAGSYDYAKACERIQLYHQASELRDKLYSEFTNNEEKYLELAFQGSDLGIPERQHPGVVRMFQQFQADNKDYDEYLAQVDRVKTLYQHTSAQGAQKLDLTADSIEKSIMCDVLTAYAEKKLTAFISAYIAFVKAQKKLNPADVQASIAYEHLNEFLNSDKHSWIKILEHSIDWNFTLRFYDMFDKEWNKERNVLTNKVNPASPVRPFGEAREFRTNHNAPFDFTVFRSPSRQAFWGDAKGSQPASPAVAAVDPGLPGVNKAFIANVYRQLELINNDLANLKYKSREVFDLLISIERWRAWTLRNHSNTANGEQSLFIIKTLLEILTTQCISKAWTRFGNDSYNWGEGLGKAITIPLARMLGVSDEAIAEFAKAEKVTKTIKENDQPKTKTHVGYHFLENEMLIKWQSLSNNIKLVDHSEDIEKIVAPNGTP